MKDPIEAARYSNRMQAEIAVNLLKSFGIECRLWADDLGGIGPGQSCIKGVKVIVAAKDVEKGKQVLHGRLDETD